jgi:hypothetical protein
LVLGWPGRRAERAGRSAVVVVVVVLLVIMTRLFPLGLPRG